MKKFILLSILLSSCISTKAVEQTMVDCRRHDALFISRLFESGFLVKEIDKMERKSGASHYRRIGIQKNNQYDYIEITQYYILREDLKAIRIMEKNEKITFMDICTIDDDFYNIYLNVVTKKNKRVNVNARPYFE